MSWNVIGPVIAAAMAVVAVVAKVNHIGELFAFGVVMALSFASSVLIHRAKHA